MNYDEQAVVCESLAELLRAGVTLPEALRQVAGMVGNQKLGTKLATISDQMACGVPLSTAVDDADLPETISRVLKMGDACEDLVPALDAAARYCRDWHDLRHRLIAAIWYPLFIVGGSMVAATGLAVAMQFVGSEFAEIFEDMLEGGQLPLITRLMLWWASISGFVWKSLLGWMTLIVTVVWVVKPLRDWVRWRLPGVRDIYLAQLGSSVSMLMNSGMTVAEALKTLERQTRCGRLRSELRWWSNRLASGQTRFGEWTNGSRLVPPMFVALVDGYGNDLAGGFRAAGNLYHQVALGRIDMMLRTWLEIFMGGLVAVILFQFLFFGIAMMLPMIETTSRIGG